MKSKALRRAGIGLAGLVGLILLVILVLLGLFFLRLEQSKPRLDGDVPVTGLAAPVRIDRDAAGVPTLTGRNRADLAYATGYLHAQERYFQMDMMRRVAAGELGSLFGPAALKIDEKIRLHLFRARARMVFAHMTPPEQTILRSYVAGVNKGLADLAAPPFEYMLLRQMPQPWRPEDSLLVVYAMYLDLQEGEPIVALDHARAAARVGPAMADLLYPLGTELDAPLDGSPMPSVALPAKLGAALPAPHGNDVPEPIVKGSNNWVVGGGLTRTGAAMVANDMHLGLRVPNIWYRARLVVLGQLDIVGVTLPGMFPIVVGSNTHVAWGFTVAHVASHDAVIVDPIAGRKDWYATPKGPRPIAVRHEQLCAAGACRDLPVRSTIWGPIVATLPDGREVADRWVAHDDHAVKLAPFLAIEQARTVQDVIVAAHQTAMPDQNMVIGDSAGHIAWTIVGQIPRRFGMSGRDPTSWADGSRGWAGFLSPTETPTIIDPPAARLWSANARTLGGATLARLGPGNYDDGARALRIRQRLFARNRFIERDMLSIQLDPTALRMPFWQGQMLAALEKNKNDPRLAAMIAPVKAWDGRAEPASIGYRLIRAFRIDAIRNAYVAYVGKPEDTGISSYALTSSEQAMRELLRARPPAVVPPGSASWDAFLAAALADVAKSVDDEAGGDVNLYTWGRWLTASIHHPLAQAIPLLGLLTDPKDESVPGDNGVVRAQARGAGPSERLAVSPGHEAQGLFHMPGGQSGAPLAPYYLAGHRDWVEGRATPLLPGTTRWTLTLRP